MEAELPSITYQRRKYFRPTQKEVNYAYKILNFYLFDNRLRKPYIELGQRRKTWGFCTWESELQATGSHCNIYLSNKWFCQQWFLQTLAHEMVHQYQWDITRWEDHDGKYVKLSEAHGPDFFQFRERFAYYGLNLKTAYGMKRWFRHQDFTRC
jgi:hypothetical protein